MPTFSRRHALVALASTALGAPLRIAAAERTMPLSFGTYGLPGYSIVDAIDLLSTIGYDSIEIACMAGYHGSPDQLSKAQRLDIRKSAASAGLPIGALMGLPKPTENRAEAQQNREWVKRMLELAHDLSPDRPPLIQTVLGGGTWDEKRALFRDTLGSWAELSREAGVELSIKPHRGHAMSRVEDGVWLIDQLNAQGALTLVYDFSHYAFRDIDVDQSISLAMPHLGYVVVKDAIHTGGKVRFQLPGESGDMPHAETLKKLSHLGYRGEVCCEVSSHVWKAEGYAAKAGADTCFENLSRIYEEAGINE